MNLQALSPGVRAHEVHALMNANYEDHAVINAELLKTLLSQGFSFAR